MSLHHCLAAYIIAITLTPAFAADSKGNFTVLSLGTRSCGQVVASFDKEDLGKMTNGIWVDGYLTAINSKVFDGEDVAKGTDPAGRDLWIYNYCKANPLDTLNSATHALVTELFRRAR